MPIAHDADPWVRPPLGGGAVSSRHGVVRDGPGPQAELSFADLIDVLNPLQHIPLVSSLYRQATGDEIEPAARILGASLYGGPVGFVAAANLTVVQETTGQSPDRLVGALVGVEAPGTSEARETVAWAPTSRQAREAGTPGLILTQTAVATPDNAPNSLAAHDSTA